MKKNWSHGNHLGPCRVPNLALNHRIFSKVNGTVPPGSGGHSHTIFSNGRFLETIE